MGHKERKIREREDRKINIQKSAIELFLSDGFENVTIRKIAEKIEYSPATIYLYFKDKADILMAIHQQGFNILAEYQNKVITENNDLILLLKKMAFAYIEFAIENPTYYNFLFVMTYKQKGLKSADQWEEGRVAFDTLRQIVIKCAENKIIKSSDTEEVSFAIWSFVHGICTLIVGQNGGPVKIENEKEFISKTVHFFFDSIKK